MPFAATAAAGTGAPSSPDRHAALTLRQEVERYLDPSREGLERDALAHTAPYSIAFAANAENVVETWTARCRGRCSGTLSAACCWVWRSTAPGGCRRSARTAITWCSPPAVSSSVSASTARNSPCASPPISACGGRRRSRRPPTTSAESRTALGYLALVMLACRRGLVPRLRRALAPVGRMALTNYLMQSTICLIVFHGLGFGLWNRLDRAELYLVVAAIWPSRSRSAGGGCAGIDSAPWSGCGAPSPTAGRRCGGPMPGDRDLRAGCRRASAGASPLVDALLVLLGHPLTTSAANRGTT